LKWLGTVPCPSMAGKDPGSLHERYALNRSVRERG
jgi:hypothetical protein